MTRLPFLDRSRLHVSSRAAWGGKRNLRMAEGRYLMDDIFEWALSKRGRENIALSCLALGSIAGIYLVGRYG